MTKVGPTLYRLPRLDQYECDGCVHYKRTIVRTGRQPVYSAECLHRDVRDRLDMPRIIPGDGPTPVWCPVHQNRGGQ